MSWTTTKTGICNTLQTALGLSAGKLFFGFEDGSPLPGLPFCAVQRKSITPMGSTPVLTQTDNLVPTPGQEVITQSTMMIRMVWMLDYFDVKGGNAYETLAGLNASLHSPRAVNALCAVNTGLWNIGEIRSVPSIRWATYEDRAQVELTFGLHVSNVDYATYIEHVEGTVSSDGGVTTSTWSLDLPNPD